MNRGTPRSSDRQFTPEQKKLHPTLQQRANLFVRDIRGMPVGVDCELPD
jgi:hypothetical protein